MPFPLIAAALPYVGYGLMALGSLVGAGTYIYNTQQQKQVTQRQEEYSKKQSEDWNNWLSDYERNTGVKPHYRYLGQSGQAEYLRNVQLPNYANQYNMYRSNTIGSIARAGIGVGMSGAFAYRHWRNSGYRSSVEVDKDYGVSPDRIGVG